MTRFPEANDIQSWIDYVDTLPSLGEQWVESAKLPGNPVILSDTLGANLKVKTTLAGTIVLSKRIAKHSPEQNIGLLMPTTAASMIASMAVLVLGKTLVTLNYTAPMKSILSAIEQAELKTVYTSSRFLENLKSRGVDLSSLDDKVNLIMLEDLRGEITAWEKISTMLMCKLYSASHLRKKFCASPALENTAVILFSSGSEGPPKGVMLSHKNILANVKQVSNILNADSEDVIMGNLPIFHSFGMTACLFLSMLERIKMICHTDPTDVVTNAKAIREHKATLFFGTSSFFRLYIKNRKVKADDLSSLKLIIAGAEKLQTEISAAFTQRFDKVICEGYGCTELSPVACVNTPFENFEQPFVYLDHDFY